MTMLWEEIEEKYGKEIGQKMKKQLKGITVRVRKDGKIDFPESDIRLAYKIVTGKKVHSSEWD